MNEQETRTNLITPAIQEAGWGTVEGSRIREEFPISKGHLIGNGQRSKPDKADHVLQYCNRNLADIEVISEEKHYTEGVGQAKGYAERLQVRYTYSTNGLRVYGIDMLEGKEDVVTVYPSPEELWEMTFAEAENPLYPLPVLLLQLSLPPLQGVPPKIASM